MIFGTSYHISSIDLSTCPQVSTNGQPISYATNTKSLGVHLDQELSWNAQVAKIVAKVNSSLF